MLFGGLGVHHNSNNVNQHLCKSYTRGNSWAEIMTLLASESDERGQIYPLLSCLAAVRCHSAPRVNRERDFSAMNRVKDGRACSSCRSVCQTLHPLHFYFQDYSGFRDRLQGEHLTACQRISISRPKQFRVQLGCRKSWSILCPLPIIDNKSVWKANVHETWTFQAEKQINENQSNSTVWFVP